MSGLVAFDTETRGLDWFDPTQTAFLGSWADKDGEYHADLSDPDQAERFMEALRSASGLVCHNLSFDVHMVRATLGLDVTKLGVPLHDTANLSRIMYPDGQKRGGHGLKNLASVHLGVNGDEAEQHIIELAKTIGGKLKETGGYYDVWRAYPEPMELYARLDARYTWDLYALLRGKISETDLKVYEMEQQVALILIEAERVGVKIDQAPVLRLREQYTRQREETHARLLEVLGEDALGGPGSDAALLEALVAQGIPLYRKTETGQLATNVFALQEFEDDYPFIADLFAYRQANKFLVTYIEPMVGRSEVHPSFRQLGAWTSRMSCMRPNMQNIPKRAGKEVREMFVPRPGSAFVVYDFESIEVRLLAYYLGDPWFRKLIADGHDPHAWMATMLHGGAIEQYVKGAAEEPKRSAAKNTLFAITYGAGAPRVSDMNKLAPGPYAEEGHPLVLKGYKKVGDQLYAEGKALIAKIKSALPGYGKLNKRIKDKINQVGYVNTIMGRRNPVNPDKAYVGLNALIQGSAAEIMKLALIEVARAVEPYDGVPLLVVHDECLVECPIEHAEHVAQVMEDAMTNAWKLDPPLSVEGSVVTTSYADA